MHRMIVRKLRRDPTIIERAKAVHARQAEQFADWPFVQEWDELLALPLPDLVPLLISCDREMVRLRNSSPFYLVHRFQGSNHIRQLDRVCRTMCERRDPG